MTPAMKVAEECVADIMAAWPHSGINPSRAALGIVGIIEKAQTIMGATTEWMEPTLVDIVEDDWYLVQTNGMEWRDHDLFVWKGVAVSMRLKPEMVRGRPIRIARILKDAT